MKNVPAETTSSKMYRTLHGWISLLLMAAVCGIGFIAIFRHHRLMAFTYLVVSASGMVGVLYAFCAKCTCRNSCRHIFLGSLTRYLPSRDSAPYTTSDLLMTVAGIAPIIVFPQYWLFGWRGMLLLFWQLSAALFVEIILFVCKGCDNIHCPAKRMRK